MLQFFSRIKAKRLKRHSYQFNGLGKVGIKVTFQKNDNFGLASPICLIEVIDFSLKRGCFVFGTFYNAADHAARYSHETPPNRRSLAV
jgi:hypothetical protein